MKGQVMSQDTGDIEVFQSWQFRHSSPSASILLYVYTWWEQRHAGIMYIM